EVQSLYDRQGGIWKFSGTELPEGLRLLCKVSEIRAARLNRNGDMGADPADAFEAPLHPKQAHRFEVALDTTPVFVEFEPDDLAEVSQKKGELDLTEAEAAREKLASTLSISTPDPYINTL